MGDFSYEILDLLAKYENDTEAALSGETDPKCLYAFSPLRENLFEWIEFEKTDRVLQIGSDYGSFTGLFSARAGEVVVLDSHDENLEVNRIRYGQRGNVRYVSGELLEMGRIAAGASRGVGTLQGAGEAESCPPVPAFREYKPVSGADEDIHAVMEQPFDYVIMAGVFELYKKEEAGALLKAAAGFLKPGGTLFAAAENESGARYWMGAEPFAVSFLEKEYRELFSGLEEQPGGEFTMYYPVPDYRYPAAIYSDDYLPEPGEVSNVSARLDGPGVRLGSEEEAMARACRDGVFPKFSNSFLGAFKRG